MEEHVTGKWHLEKDGYLVFECDCGFTAEDARKEDKRVNSWSNLADHFIKDHGFSGGNISGLPS